MPTRSTVLGFLTLGLLVAMPVLLIAVHADNVNRQENSTVHAPRSTVHAGPKHVTACFDEHTHRRLAKAFVGGKVSAKQHQGCGVGLVQVQLDLDTARELLGSIVATLNARDQAIEREKIRKEREGQRDQSGVLHPVTDGRKLR